MNPVLKYRGGKSRDISYFISYLPSDFNCYVEPFFGGGAVYFYLEPDRAIINDVNERLMLFYCQLRNNYPEMRLQLDGIQSLYYKMRQIFNYPDGSYLDGVVYYFINKTAYSGMIRYNKNGEFNVPFGRYPNLNTKLVTEQHANLLKKAELYSCDYWKVFDMVGENDFVFLDPPYDCVFNDYGNIDMLNGFDETEHRRLAEDFRNLSCRSLMVIGKTPLTVGLYEKYVVGEYYKNYVVNIKNRFNNDKMYLIVKNF